MLLLLHLQFINNVKNDKEKTVDNWCQLWRVIMANLVLSVTFNKQKNCYVQLVVSLILSDFICCYCSIIISHFFLKFD